MNDTARKIDLSVVIVYTNVAQLDEAVSYIEKQSIYPSVETVLLDNRENRFTSAASALNYGAEQAHGEVVVFMHQDVYLWDERTLEKYYNFLIDKPNAIAGLAGVAKADGIIYYDICETKDGTYHKYSTKGEIMPALSVDECMFAMKRSLWEKLKFDEVTCNNWHFYGADICFHNLTNGGENYIYSADGCHESTGNAFNSSFRKTLKAIVLKYKGKLPRIQTTCVNIKCSMPAYRVYCCKSYIMQMKRRIFG